MTGDVGRAIGFAVVGALALLAPLLEGRVDDRVAAVGTVAPFVVVAAVAYLSTSGPLFELFARPGDREEGRLYGLASFSLGIAGLAVIYVAFEFPVSAFLVAVFALTVGNLGQELTARYTPDPAVGTSAFAVLGTIGAVCAMLLAGVLGASVPALPLAVFVAASGALLGALIRSVLFVRDDSLVVLSVGLVVWFFLELGLAPTLRRVGIGIALTAALGYVAYGLGTASVTGMLTGVLLALFTVVLGGFGWFVLLVTFFGLGGLASKYRYDEKLDRGIAQENEGARGGGNVLANSAVALVAVVAFAVSGHVGVPSAVFRFAFAGAVAAALADTFSSEFGGLFDTPRLITTLRPVAPGTDGAVTWQGVVAGLVGSAIIGGLSGVFFGLNAPGVLLVVFAGVVGMTVDSLLGATLEGDYLGNQGVNLLATLSAGLVAGLAALWL
ncbi:DUF92 domain-containing protein [Natronomonas halophila]|uniref:DUF92 domain-containing protein n=1 Tax=Natronomonas halophila TaxID=2747817 RepID=UPI0015B4FC21|nr:DUF92 domain-containing protein [Natronomonas halophila]QLD84754.1 DUF92 domain-containing protein [Natronomonas halophila]